MLPVSPKKKPVDLDALAAELKAADVSFLDREFWSGDRRLECYGWVIWTGETPSVSFQSVVADPIIWTAFDIIRKHVEAV